MTRHVDVDRALESWLAEGPSQLPDQVIDRIVRQLDETKQRRPTWLPGRALMNRTFYALVGAAAVLVVAALALGLYVNQPGTGGQPSETPSPMPSPTVAASPVEPTASPSLTATPMADPDGELAPGTYAMHPLPAPNDSLTVTFTVPEGWEALAGTALVQGTEPDVGPPGGVAIQFEDVTSLNGDPCDWSGTADDVTVGSTVDDLVEALRAQTAYEVSEPVDVTIGGYEGTRVDIVHPTEPFAGESADAPECDDGNFRIWSTAAHGPHPIYAQGPANRWQTNILDVNGTRLVIVTMDFPATSPDHRAEMDAIIDSIVIEP